jgi:PAS domain S-box-containing protein
MAMEPTADEIRRLQGCINDLLSVLALPAIWHGQGPSQIVSTLLDALLAMLRLDFAYARLSEAIDGSPVEVVRLAQRRHPAAQPPDVGRALNRWLTSDPPASPFVVPNPIGAGEVSIAALRLGLQETVGVLVAGSQRADFPTTIEMLLLRVATNQAAIELQEVRRLSEQRRAAEEIRFQAGLLDAVDQAVIAVNIHGVITYWNRFAEQLYGWSAPEVIGRNLMDIIHVQGAPRATAEMLSRWQRGERWMGECLVRHRDGRTFPVLVIASPLSNSEEVLLGVVEVSIDITERKRAAEELEQRVAERTSQLTAVNEELRQEILERQRAEEALRKSERQFHALFDDAAIGMALVNAVGHPFESNRALQRMLGYSAEELRGMPFMQFTHPDDVALNWQLFTELVRGQRNQYQLEKRYYRKDGRVVWGNLTMSLVRDERGAPLFGIGTVEDITERRRAEEALRQTQAELTHVTRVMTVGALTASIAHEVNQPLAAVVTNGNACLRWLARPVPDVEEARAAVERVIREANRASEVIRRIRALAQKTDPQAAWLDLNDVLREVVALVHGEARQQRVALWTDLAPALPPVLGDRVQLQQVTLNLLLNGIEALQAVTARPRELWIRSQRHEADAVLVAVRDAGIGLDPQQMARLFDPFFTTKPGGMGIGLAISRTIVEAHGGRLWATPNDGPGATFQFVLPLSSERPS